MFEASKKLLKAMYLEDGARALFRGVTTAKRNLLGVDSRIKRNFFNESRVKKLHIGCADHLLDGWLNTDYFPPSSSILHLDATKKFPFEDNTFDYAFSEHMIEHISFSDGEYMLSECYRVLKQNGKVRITTPDLVFLINLYKEDKSDLQKKYIQWASDVEIKFAPYYDAAFVINNFMRSWGHQFIYDRKTLGSALEKAGFKDVHYCNLMESESPDLRNLERIERMPPGFLKHESLIMEGTKK